MAKQNGISGKALLAMIGTGLWLVSGWGCGLEDGKTPVLASSSGDENEPSAEIVLRAMAQAKGGGFFDYGSYCASHCTGCCLPPFSYQGTEMGQLCLQQLPAWVHGSNGEACTFDDSSTVTGAPVAERPTSGGSSTQVVDTGPPYDYGEACPLERGLDAFFIPTEMRHPSAYDALVELYNRSSPKPLNLESLLGSHGCTDFDSPTDKNQCRALGLQLCSRYCSTGCCRERYSNNGQFACVYTSTYKRSDPCHDQFAGSSGGECVDRRQ